MISCDLVNISEIVMAWGAFGRAPGQLQYWLLAEAVPNATSQTSSCTGAGAKIRLRAGAKNFGSMHGSAYTDLAASMDTRPAFGRRPVLGCCLGCDTRRPGGRRRSRHCLGSRPSSSTWRVGAGRGLAAAHGTTHGLSMAGTQFLAGAIEKHCREHGEHGFAKRFTKSTGSCEEANSLEESEPKPILEEPEPFQTGP